LFAYLTGEKDIETETQTLEKFFKEEIKSLPETVAKEVSLWIVGEAYKKWDSVTSYFPSLTFIFVEDTESNAPRRCQIKVRLKKPGTDLTQADIEKLRVLTRAHRNMGYSWGRVAITFPGINVLKQQFMVQVKMKFSIF
jgi:hypothetical protein